MMIGQDDHAKPQANVFRESAQGTKDDFWARRHRKTRQEVVFHEPDRIKSHLVGQDTLFECLFDHGMVVDDWPLHLIRQTESHAIPHSKRRKTCALHLQAWRIVAELWPERNVYLYKAHAFPASIRTKEVEVHDERGLKASAQSVGTD